MWFIFALASALLAGFRRTGEKRLLTTFDHFTLGYLMQLLSLPIGIGALFAFHQAINPFALGPDFWLLLLFDSLVFYPVNTWLFYKALKQGELSKVMPVQSLGPVVTVLFALVILHEIPSALALAAIVLIVSGLYILNLKGNKPHNPLKPFMEHKASLYMLGSTLAIALTVPIEKLCIRQTRLCTQL
jgi:transporter family protein